MPCHALFSPSTIWWFGIADLGLAHHNPVCSVWYGTSYMNFRWPHIFKHQTEGKNIVLYLSRRRWLEGTRYKAVMTYARVFIWKYWGESWKSQPDQLMSCLRFKPVASKVHVRSVNAQANLISNSCQGDAIWSSDTQKILAPDFTWLVCSTCNSKISGFSHHM